ncbi:MAG: hypothetical protein Q8P08_01100 [bacterium]|nr:hypothetical protein [bacterium]
MFDKIVKNPLYLSIIAAVLIVAASIIYVSQKEGLFFSENLSAEKVGEVVVNYINNNADLGGNTASLVETVEESGVYKVTVEIAGQQFTSYASLDGKLLFPEGYVLENEEETADVQSENNQEETFTSEQLESLANCLTEKGVKFYGAFWCGVCDSQKELFGEAAQFLPYIECSDEDRNLLPACQAEGISSFPTWEFSGEKVPGLKTLEELVQSSSCSI